MYPLLYLIVIVEIPLAGSSVNFSCWTVIVCNNFTSDKVMTTWKLQYEQIITRRKVLVVYNKVCT
jgi:hypothetical protein